MKHENVIERENGTKVKIVAELFSSPTGQTSIGNYVLTCDKGDSTWKLVHDNYAARKTQMSVEEYVSHGRKPMFYAASIAEILKTNQELLVLSANQPPYLLH